MKTILRNKKGFSLIELLVALMILSIIIVSFTQVFTSSVTSIFTMGNKTKAVAQAQAVLDGIYQDRILTHTVSGSNLSNFAIAAEVDEATLTSQPYDASNPIYYSVDTQTIAGTNYHRVTVLVFYQNGKHHVTLTALIP